MNDIFTVAIYLVDQAYGGPEEGGWYYYCGTPSTLSEHLELIRHFTNEEEARNYASELEEKHLEQWNEGRHDISSVLSEGKYQVHIIEGYTLKPFPEEKPHYE